MKKIVLICISLVIIIALLFSIFTRVPIIDAQSVEIRFNSSENTKNKVIEIRDSELIEKLNTIISARIYYNQPYINSYSRDEIDYELDLREINNKGKIIKIYKILLNNDKAINIANQSRLDIININYENNDYSKNKSLLLSVEQYKKIISIIEPFIQ